MWANIKGSLGQFSIKLSYRIRKCQRCKTDEMGLSLGKKKQLGWQVANKDNFFCLSSSEITWIDYIQLICIDWKLLSIDQDNQNGINVPCSTFPWNFLTEHKLGEHSRDQLCSQFFWNNLNFDFQYIPLFFIFSSLLF